MGSIYDHEVYYADITFHVPGLADLQEIELFELASDWSAENVNWNDAWDTPGGDVRGGTRRYWITDERTGDLVKFVVTRSISRFMSGTDSNHGFLIVLAGENGGQLDLPTESPVLSIHSGP